MKRTLRRSAGIVGAVLSLSSLFAGVLIVVSLAGTVRRVTDLKPMPLDEAVSLASSDGEVFRVFAQVDQELASAELTRMRESVSIRFVNETNSEQKIVATPGGMLSIRGRVFYDLYDVRIATSADVIASVGGPGGAALFVRAGEGYTLRMITLVFGLFCCIAMLVLGTGCCIIFIFVR